ncbi:hypothetical protein BDQ17DRAFT_960647 [Cyathus striatus]|nr:hypothetical protein BDQ17DRAFT_960647 [Cyathus striatus]
MSAPKIIMDAMVCGHVNIALICKLMYTSDRNNKSKSIQNLSRASDSRRIEKSLDRIPRPKPGENLKAIDLGGSTRTRSKPGNKVIYHPVPDVGPSSAPAAAQALHYAPEASIPRKNRHYSLQPSIYAPPNPAALLHPNVTQHSYQIQTPQPLYSQPQQVAHQRPSRVTDTAPQWNHVSVYYPTTIVHNNVPPPIPRQHRSHMSDHVSPKLQYNIHRHFRSGHLVWDVTKDPSEARYAKYDYRELPDLDGLAVAPGVSEITISFTNSRLSRWKKRWEPLVVRAPHGGAITVKNVLDAVHGYFNQRIRHSEYETESQDVRDRLMATVSRRVNYGSPRRDPLRLDVLRGCTRFASLAVSSEQHRGETALSLAFTYP